MLQEITNVSDARDFLNYNHILMSASGLSVDLQSVRAYIMACYRISQKEYEIIDAEMVKMYKERNREQNQ